MSLTGRTPMPAPGGALSAYAAVRDRENALPALRGANWRAAPWLYLLVSYVAIVVVRPSGRPFALTTGAVLCGVGALLALVSARRSPAEFRRRADVAAALSLVPVAVLAFA